MTTEFKSLVNNIIHLSVLITSTVLGEGGVFFILGFVFFMQESCPVSKNEWGTPTLEMYRQAAPLEPMLTAYTIPCAAQELFSVSEHTGVKQP